MLLPLFSCTTAVTFWPHVASGAPITATSTRLNMTKKIRQAAGKIQLLLYFCLSLQQKDTKLIFDELPSAHNCWILTVIKWLRCWFRALCVLQWWHYFIPLTRDVWMSQKVTLHIECADLVATTLDDVDTGATHDPIYAVFIHSGVS